MTTCPVCHTRPATRVCIDPTDACGPAGIVACDPCTLSTCAGFVSIVPDPADGVFNAAPRVVAARNYAARYAAYIAAVAAAAPSSATDDVMLGFGLADTAPYGDDVTRPYTYPDPADVAAVRDHMSTPPIGRPTP